MKARISLGIFLVAFASPSVAAADALRLEYDIHIGGFHAISLAAKASNGSADYAIEIDARTRGIAGWFGDWTGQGVSRGQVVDGKLRPQLHRTDAVWHGEKHLTELRYVADGTVATTIDPLPRAERRDPVPPEMTRGTVDGFSTVIGLIRAVNATGRCEGTWRVFDGRRRFDVSLSDAGPVQVDKSSYNAYAGPALKCRAVTRRIAGFWKGRDYSAEDRPADIWMAQPIAGGPWIPVRVEAETIIGTLVVNLRAASH